MCLLLVMFHYFLSSVLVILCLFTGNFIIIIIIVSFGRFVTVRGPFVSLSAHCEVFVII